MFYPYTLTVNEGANVVQTYVGNSAGVISDSLSPGSYTLSLTSAGAPCPREATLEVTDEGDYPFSPTALSPVSYCRNGDAVPLQATMDSASLTGTSLHWYDGNLNYLSDDAPVPSTAASGVYKFYVREQYKTCLGGSDTVTITIDQQECNYDVTIHNAITPNGDGKNDRWVIDNLAYYPDVTVQVFTKLGDKVYEKVGYQNDWNGGDLPSGVYYYLVRLNGKNRTSGTENFTGYLLIKR
jgi:gliding motility-associated-like protein